MIVSKEITTRDEWLEWRKADVTASVVGALFGVHPYTTALRLYVEKRGVEFENKDNAAMRRGRWLEPAVAKAVEEMRPEWRLRLPGVYLRDPDLRLGCTPDYLIEGDARGIGVLQAKTVAPSVYQRDWDGGATVPTWIVLQCATEMMLADAKFGAVAALLVDAHAMDVVIHELPRHPEAEQKITEAVKQFWLDVESGKEPAPVYGKDAEALRALYPTESPGKVFDATGDNELPILLEERCTLTTFRKEADDRVGEIDEILIAKLGDCESMIGLNGYKVTFKSYDRQKYTVPAKTIRSLRVYDRREKTQ